MAKLAQMPLVAYAEPQGAFYVFLDVRETIGKSAGGAVISDDLVFAQELLERGRVAVIPGTAFLLPGYIRISFATSEEEIRAGMDQTRTFLESLT